MKTKKVTMKKSPASFSSAASRISKITLPRAPWDVEPDGQEVRHVEAEDHD